MVENPCRRVKNAHERSHMANHETKVRCPEGTVQPWIRYSPGYATALDMLQPWTRYSPRYATLTEDICMHVHACTHIDTHMHTCTYTCIHAHTCMHTHDTRMHMHACAHTCTHTHVCTHINTNA